MKLNGSFKKNIEFLIDAYKRELENAEKDNREIYEVELIEAYIEELKALIKLSK